MIECYIIVNNVYNIKMSQEISRVDVLLEKNLVFVSNSYNVIQEVS